MTRLTIAPAGQVTGLEMFDRVTGSSPAKRAKRDEHQRITTSGDAEAIEAYRQRCLDEAIAGMQAKANAFAADHGEPMVEVHGDPLLKARAA